MTGIWPGLFVIGSGRCRHRGPLRGPDGFDEHELAEGFGRLDGGEGDAGVEIFLPRPPVLRRVRVGWWVADEGGVVGSLDDAVGVDPQPVAGGNGEAVVLVSGLVAAVGEGGPSLRQLVGPMSAWRSRWWSSAGGADRRTAG